MEFDPSVDLETQYFPSYSEEEEEDDGGSSEKSSKMGYVLDKGLSLGRKLVVTGFVISSVPLLLPPLLVVSALGFTFSLPFGFVYASYACTEKLMSKLLPPQVMVNSATVPLLLEGVSETEDLDKTGTVEEIRGPGGLEEDVKTSLPIVEEKDDELMEKGSEKYAENGKSVAAEIPEKLDKKHEAEVTDKSSGLVETEKGGKKRIWGKLKPSKKRKAQAGGDKKVENPSQESKASSSDMVSPEAVAEEKTANEGTEISRESEQAVESDSIKSKGIDTRSLESSPAVGEVKVVEEEGEEEKQEKKPLVLKADSALVDIPELKHEETHHLKGDKNVSDAESVEGPSEDEKIWRKIDLIRAIVGFKTPRHPSYFEELKALYAFTGIELPQLVKDPSDLTEFNNKLHFLMSVIGVK